MPTRPNILLITTHDTGRHLGCYGVPSVHTPNLDRLAGEGWRFGRYFAASALCSPSRGAQMTGRWPQTNGMMGLCHGMWGWRLNDGERHFSHRLREAGYRTVLLGHQHETTDIDAQLGFDEHGLHRAADSYEHLPSGPVADGVCDYLTGRAAAEAPFYLQVGFFETHRPFDFGGAAPDDAKGVHVPGHLADTPAGRAELAAFQGNIRAMDANVGRILDALREADLERDTLVIWTTDHGIPFPRAKATLFDPGIGIGLLVRWPGGGIEGGRVCDHLAGNVDLVPTLLELAGLDVPDDVEGLSFAGAFDGEEPHREWLFAMQHGHTPGGHETRCVRTDRYKLVRSFSPCRVPAVPAPFEGGGPDQDLPLVALYDLQADPLETTNLADEPACAAVRAELDAALLGWLRAVNDPILHGPMVTPYYRRALADWAGPTPTASR